MRVGTWLGLCLGVVAVRAHAQSLAPGVWTGTLKVAGGPEVAVEYAVQGAGDSLAVTMKPVTGPAQPVSDLKLGERELAFRWGGFACALERKGGSRYEGACTTADGSTAQLTLNAPRGGHSPAPRARARDLVTRDALLATGSPTVYEALQRIHPEWLRPRAPASSVMLPTEVHVYLNDQPVGGVEFLHTLPPDAVFEIRFYSASEATTRWGTGNTAGVIAVTQRVPER